MKPYLYVRALRHAEHTVFCVQEGQKYYYDQQFGTRSAYSSGQQVKRSILDAILSEMNEMIAPITFNYELSTEKDKIDKNKTTLGNGEPWSPCDPSYTDQLLGGWMKASSESKSITVKRRSPLSISAMRPLHPLLGGLEGVKENLTFDRSSNPDRHPVRVRDSKGAILSEEDIQKFLTETKRTLSRRTWIPDHTRASGLFVYDIAIDLRTLFCVSLNNHEPELHPDIIEKLRSNGWVGSKNIFGSCLVCPEERRIRIIEALSSGLINWRITSNQARTFSLMETLAIAISDNANKIASSMYARLDDEKERPSAKPVIESIVGVETYITSPAGGYIAGMQGTADALDNAEEEIKRRLMAFDYEGQLVPA